jgi:hypothetical protein
MEVNMGNESRLKNPRRVNLWLEEAEYNHYRKSCDKMGMPFVTWARMVLRKEGKYSPAPRKAPKRPENKAGDAK